MVGDKGMEAGNKRQRGPLGRKAWGGTRSSPASTGAEPRASERRTAVLARLTEGRRRVSGGDEIWV